MAKVNELTLSKKVVNLKGKDYSNYFVMCDYHGKKSEARIIPKDNGGYAILDVLFEVAGEKPVTLVRKVSKQTDSNGSTRSVVNYTACFTPSPDEDTIEVAVKPYRPSDEDWIKLFISTLKFIEVDEETGEILKGDGNKSDE